MTCASPPTGLCQAFDGNLKNKLVRDNNWCSETFQSIDWMAYKTAILIIGFGIQTMNMTSIIEKSQAATLFYQALVHLNRKSFDACVCFLPLPRTPWMVQALAV
jgi:hypothetical protein